MKNKIQPVSRREFLKAGAAISAGRNTRKDSTRVATRKIRITGLCKTNEIKKLKKRLFLPARPPPNKFEGATHQIRCYRIQRSP